MLCVEIRGSGPYVWDGIVYRVVWGGSGSSWVSRPGPGEIACCPGRERALTRPQTGYCIPRLAIPVTSALLEQVWSQSTQVITTKRVYLDEKISWDHVCERKCVLTLQTLHTLDQRHHKCIDTISQWHSCR